MDLTDDYDCFFHGKEPLRSEHVTTCGECGHAYTEDELRAEDLRVRIDIWRATNFDGPVPRLMPLDTIVICPLCTHDF